MNKKTKVNVATIGSTDALVVIDAQHDFVDPAGALYVSGEFFEEGNDEVIQNILMLAELNFDYRVTTEDKHLPGHIEFSIFPEHCVFKSPGQKYIPELQHFYDTCDENIIKGDNVAVIAYSVSTSEHFLSHIAMLRNKGIKRIFLAGWAYDYCVGESAIAYAAQGFEVFVIRDATRSVPKPHGDTEKMKKKLELYGVKEIFTHSID